MYGSKSKIYQTASNKYVPIKYLYKYKFPLYKLTRKADNYICTNLNNIKLHYIYVLLSLHKWITNIACILIISTDCVFAMTCKKLARKCFTISGYTKTF